VKKEEGRGGEKRRRQNNSVWFSEGEGRKKKNMNKKGKEGGKRGVLLSVGEHLCDSSHGQKRRKGKKRREKKRGEESKNSHRVAIRFWVREREELGGEEEKSDCSCSCEGSLLVSGKRGGKRGKKVRREGEKKKLL